MRTIPWRKHFGTVAWFLPVALLFQGVLLLRKYALSIRFDWYEVGKGYAIFGGLVAVTAVWFRFAPPKTSAPNTEGRALWRLLALGGGLLFAFFYLHDITYNSLVLWGEWRSSITSAAQIWNQLSSGSFYPPPDYNIGMGYFYLPFYASVGESIWAAKILYLACWTLALIMLALVWKRYYGAEGMLSLLVVVSTLAYGLAIQRRYKWHAIAPFLVAALFWIMGRLEDKPRIIWNVVLAVALVAGVVCYHGCLIYFVFIALCLAFSLSFRPYAGWRSWAKEGGIALLLIIAIGYVVMSKCRGFIDYGLMHSISGYFNDATRISYDAENPREFLRLYFGRMNPMASLALIIGLVAGVANFKREWIARFATLGFLMVNMVIMVTVSFNNNDEANYHIMFVFLIIAYGIYSVLVRIPWTIVRQIAIVFLAWYFTLQEYSIYKAEFWTNGCYGMPGIVALYDLKMSGVSPGDVILMPGRDTDKRLLAPIGGFEFVLYDDILRSYEYSYLAPSIRCFRSLEGMRFAIDELMPASDGRHGSIKVYLAPTVDRMRLEGALAGLHYRCYKVSYFEREWHGMVPAYKIVILR